MKGIFQAQIVLVLASIMMGVLGCSAGSPSASGTSTPAGRTFSTVTTRPKQSPTMPAISTESPAPKPSATVRPALTSIVPLPTSTRSAVANGKTLRQGMRFSPTDTRSIFAYTNWALIKQYLGMPHLTSHSSLDQRREFWLSTNQGQGTASGFGASYVSRLPDVWGFGEADLDWEATIQPKKGPSGYVLRFRDSFKLAPVIKRFEQRKFTRQSYRGITIYHHEMDLNAQWQKDVFLPGLLNTAVMPDRYTLVLSASPEMLRRMLDAYKDDSNLYMRDKAARDTANRLGTVAAAFILVGKGDCGGLSGKPVGMPTRPPGIYQPMATEKVHPYDTLAIAYRYEGNKPLGLIVMHYESPKKAKQDLDERRKLAAKGRSNVTGNPISETLFTVQGVRVDGPDLVLRVRPVDDFPQRLFQMIYQRDMPFAACP